MKQIITDLFGTYTPITYTDTINTSSGAVQVDRIPDGIAGVDLEFVAGVLLFAVTLYCVMRILGGVLRG